MDTLAALDPNDLPPIRQSRGAVLILIRAALAALLVVILIRFHPGLGRIALFLAAWITTVFLHESGHLIAGLLARHTIDSCGAWPIVFRHTAAGWRISFGPSGFGGFVRGHSTEGNARLRRIVMVSGGPIASAIVCCICFVVAQRGRHPFWVTVGVLSALALFTSLTPGSPDGPLPDFDHLTILVENGENAKFLLAADRMQFESDSGVRPRDWPDTPAGEPDESVRTAIASAWWTLRYDRAIDSAQIDDAEKALVNALKTTPSAGGQISLRYAASWFAAWVRRDLQTAEKWHASVPAAVARKAGLTGSFALAALALVRGQPEAALESIQETKSLVGETPGGVRITFDETLEAMELEATTELRRPAGTSGQR